MTTPAPATTAPKTTKPAATKTTKTSTKTTKPAVKPAAVVKAAKTINPERLPSRAEFRNVLLQGLAANSPQTVASLYEVAKVGLKLTSAQVAVTLASGESTFQRHVRSAERALRQDALIEIVEGGKRGITTLGRKSAK